MTNPIRNACQAHGLTTRELAHHLNLSHGHVLNMHSGAARIAPRTLRDLERLAAAEKLIPVPGLIKAPGRPIIHGRYRTTGQP